MNYPHKISVAPMMDWTDRHDRYFLRLIAPDVLLYTEMITAQALIHGDTHYLLQFDASEHPVALQIGGSDKDMLAKAAKLGEEAGYDEINLNVGCPSSRVQSGRFGACLMLEPELVASSVNAMMQAVSVPVTVKSRIGVDQHDSYDHLYQFIKTVSSVGVTTFIIHARKAWLSGLSPKENREIPPLQYDTVYQIKRDFPHLNVVINGGVQTVEDVSVHLQSVDGVMIGRSAYNNPFLLAEIEKQFYPDYVSVTRDDIIRQLLPYVTHQLKKGVRLSAITRHLLGLYFGQQGAASWRRYISQHAHLKEADVSVLVNALNQMR